MGHATFNAAGNQLGGHILVQLANYIQIIVFEG